MKIFGIQIGKEKEKFGEGPTIPLSINYGTVDYNPKPPSNVINVTDLPAAQIEASGISSSFHDGEKFPGGFGDTELQFTDYWTLRHRSSQLFKENLYAAGLIRRLITNEINTGLSLESCPEESILGLEPESLDDWTENVETRFTIWGKNPNVCDFNKRSTFGAIQASARLEALISGDCLVVLRPNSIGLSSIQLISGNAIQTPNNDIKLKKGHTIEHGVELDANGSQIAYWVLQSDNFTSKRLPATSERTGRRISWLVYGTEKRLDEVRGMPILSLVLQSLKELDRYRDSVLRKSVINSMLAMFIKKTQDKPGTLPVSGGALRKTDVTVADNGGTGRTLQIVDQMPGMVVQELNVGEEPVGFGSQGIDLAFGPFEQAVIQAIAWANEMPGEILTLSFNSNYSASAAATNEFKLYLNKVRTTFGDQFCQPIYVDWLLSEVLLGRIKADGFLESWRDPTQYDKFGSWIFSDWSGAIKPSTDIKKQAQGYKILNENGWITNERAARELTGTKFAKNMKRIKRENLMKIEAERPVAEFQEEFNTGDDANLSADLGNIVETAISDSGLITG